METYLSFVFFPLHDFSESKLAGKTNPGGAGGADRECQPWTTTCAQAAALPAVFCCGATAWTGFGLWNVTPPASGSLSRLRDPLKRGGEGLATLFTSLESNLMCYSFTQALST